MSKNKNNNEDDGGCKGGWEDVEQFFQGKQGVKKAHRLIEFLGMLNVLDY